MRKLIALNKVLEGHLFMLGTDSRHYGQKDSSVVFIKIEHVPGGTNCVTTMGKLGRFIDPDRLVYYLGPITVLS